jgi:hypothetical protein
VSTRAHIPATPSGARAHALASAPAGTLQRKCACGGSGGSSGECAECEKKSATLQRRSTSDVAVPAVPPIVHDVLRSPGQPLDASTRAFFEPRFGHDFSRVRIHSGERAAESAAAVNALAYAAGPRIVFAQGQYRPGTPAGRELLAHELTHVAQQQGATGSVSRIGDANGPLERTAEATAKDVLAGNRPSTVAALPFTGALHRKVGSVTCPANVFGAPADPKAALERIDPMALDLATRTATKVAADATTVKSGIAAAESSATFLEYRDHFGLPNKVGTGFLNRLTGIVRPTQVVAASEELTILFRRFQLVEKLFQGIVNYRCPGNDPDCAGGDAFSSRGDTTISLCAGFWGFARDDERAAILVHEGLHVVFGPDSPGKPQGAIEEGQQRGPGRNFNVAGCYEFIVDSVGGGINSNATCPPVPAG